MPASRTKKKSATKVKSVKTRKVNIWLLVAGAAAVAVMGVLYVRYSSASGTIWSARSSAVTVFGGNIVQKDSGTVYWEGRSGNKIRFTAPSSGTFCMEGSYKWPSSIRMSVSDAAQEFSGYDLSSGSVKEYSHCKYVARGRLYEMKVKTGAVIFNRVRQK